MKIADRLLLISFASILLLQIGCATSNYQFGIDQPARLKSSSFRDANFGESASNPIASGGDHPKVDKLERMVQSPRRFFRKVTRRPEPTAAEIERNFNLSVSLSQTYFAANDLTDVFIDVRRYEPAEQWARLKANDEIAPIWKYTGGMLNHLRYTVLPHRAFGRDAYDPFTKTLHLNSAKPAVAVYHASESKQYQQQRFIGTYAVAQRVPLVPIAHSIASASEAISYARATEQTELESELYPATYSRVGAETISEIATLGVFGDISFFEIPFLRLAGRSVGKITGEAVASQR